MSPKRFKEIRLGLGLTQDDLSKALGVGAKAITHYETGFRRPGSTILIVMSILGSLSEKRANEFLMLLRLHAEKFKE